MPINGKENNTLLSGFWAMNEEQRRERNRVLLASAYSQEISIEERWNLLERLLLHTLHGKVITMQLLEEAEYTDCTEQLQGVMLTLEEREEEIYRLRDEVEKQRSPVAGSSYAQES